MKIYVTLLAMPLILILNGCAISEPSVLQKQEIQSPVYCEGNKQCELMFDRAAFYLVSKGLEIDTRNSYLMVTKIPKKEYSSTLAVKIEKILINPSANRYEIKEMIMCTNIFGCRPNKYETIAGMKKAMRDSKK